MHKIKIQQIFCKSKLRYLSAAKLKCSTVIDTIYHTNDNIDRLMQAIIIKCSCFAV